MLPFRFGLRLSLLVLFAALTCGGCTRRVGVFVGGGETIAHLADLDEDAAETVRAQTGFEDPAVGYKYDFLAFFFLDVWTGDGEAVLYDQESGDQYLEVGGDTLTELTGRSAEELGKPFRYRFPLGWAVILVGLGYFGFATWRRMQELG